MKQRTIKICSMRVPVLQRHLDDAHGEFECDRITIDPRGSQDRKTLTLMHEILHAIWDGSGLDEYVRGCLSLGQDPEQFEETVIKILTPHLVEALASLSVRH